MDFEKKHAAWCKRINKRIPDLANRVFNLRGKGYKGCGFHYALEKDLGSVIRSLNNYDNPNSFEFSMMCVTEVLATSLFQRVAQIEKELLTSSKKELI